MTHRRFLMAVVFIGFTAFPSVAQMPRPLPSLHVEGRNMVDRHGNKVLLHGVMDTPHPYFNGGRWGWNIDDSSVPACLNYFEKLFRGLTDASQGAYCNVFRLHLDPCWTNDPTKPLVGKKGEENISQFSADRLRRYLQSLYIPLMQKAMAHGLYVVVRPPGVCPHEIRVGDAYQQYLTTVWDIVSREAVVQQYAGQISLELANEPVVVKDATGKASDHALRDFFQPIVDKIRGNGFKGILWIPGSSWQGNYVGYARHPITDDNFGYAVHDYPGWYGMSDEQPNAEEGIRRFKGLVPVVEPRPVMITEVDWSPEKAGEGHYDEHGKWVKANYGTWATASTSKWGVAYKRMIDHYGNISMTLSGTGCYLDIDELVGKGRVVAAFGELKEACGAACMGWYKAYNTTAKPYPDDYVFSAAERRIDSICWALKDTLLMPGDSYHAPLTLFFPGGRSVEVLPKAIQYTVSAPDVVGITDGVIHAKSDGTAQITAVYTTETGETLSRKITVRVQMFSFEASAIRTDIFDHGTYDETKRVFQPGKWGQMGWQFDGGIGLSKHYLVLKLDKPQTCGAKLMLFPQQSIWGDSYEIALENKTTIVVDLTKEKTKQGKVLGHTPIYIVSLWGNGAGEIDVNNLYLTDNADDMPTAITPIVNANPDFTDVYNLYGIRVRSHVSTEIATAGLPPGIYIAGGKKVVVR